MKRIITVLLIAVLAILTDYGFAQSLTQSDFISNLLPKYMGSGGTSRLPVVFRGTVQNLTPNTKYRFYVQGGKYSDIGTNNSGAGNPMLINPDSANYVYTSSPSITTAGGYTVFKSDNSGSFTGWFAFVNTGNARFTRGNYIIPTISIGDSAGVLLYRKALNDSILVMSFNTVSADTCGTGIWGISNGTAKNIAALYDNTSGTGKPVAVTYIENEGVTVSSSVQFYADSVNGIGGRWGTIIPNVNANGIRRIEELSLSNGNVLTYNTCNVGIWPSGANTVNPAGGLTAVKIDSLDALLPVELVSFSASVNNNNVLLKWQTATETNNKGFEIQRKENSDYVTLAFIEGNGNSSVIRNYSYIDKSAQSAKYFYRLKQIDYNGAYTYSDNIEVNNAVPVKFDLLQNYPNPFNPSTTINYYIASASLVQLKIYDINGREVAVVVNEVKQPGAYSLKFNASSLASGVYLYRLTAGTNTLTKQMVLIK
jgi:hypothetical protein